MRIDIKQLLLSVVTVFVTSSLVTAQVGTKAKSRIDANVIFGMYSGLALLLDVHYPDKANGYGIVCVPGSGYQRPLGYDAPALKDEIYQLDIIAEPFVEAGYTVFVINHRTGPHFRYPAPIEDGQRAVRFIRHRALQYGIVSDRIGGVGLSSGGHLVSMLGVLDGKGDSTSTDLVERESAKLQAVVAFAPATDFLALNGDFVSVLLGSFMGMAVFPSPNMKNSIEYKTYQAASPVYHASKDDAALLLIHGDSDDVVAFEQSELMERAMISVGAPEKLIRVPQAGHVFQQKPEYPDFTGEMIRWFDRYLRNNR